MKGFKSTSTDPYTYTQSGVWKKGQYTFQAVVLSDSGYAFAFQRSDTTWQTVDLSWQVKDGSYSKIQWTFTLEVDAVAFRLIANTVTGETIVLQPMLEKGSNGSTPIAHEEDLRGMDGDNHEFIFTRNDTGIAPDTPLSTQDNDYVPEDWTDNAQGVTSEIPFEFVSMRERKNGVWLDFSPPSLWAKWGEDGLSVNLLVEGHYNSHWEGTTKVVEIVGGVDVGGNQVVKVSAVFRKGEENIAATVSQSRGFQWYVNGVHLTAFDNQPFITLDETYGDGFADYVVLSYLVNSIREEERREIINVSEGMDGIGEEFIFKANNSDTVPPVLPQTTDVGYQNDDYHGDWSDDPVAPTELNQFVWVAKRKKIGGIWEAFGTPSVWTKWVEDGEPGADGEPGSGIDTITDYYAVSTSGTIPPTTWYTTMPAKSANEYLWNYEVITYTDGRTPSETEKRVIQGKDARSIYDIKNAYAYSASDTVSPISGWQWSLSSLGTKPTGYFLWVREDIAYTDNPTNYISTKGYVVRDGDPGEDGEDGITISPNQQGYTYRADLNGDIIGSLANGMVELTIMSGSTPITCSSSLSGGAPTTNGTYRVTRTLGNGITTNSGLSGGKYRITPSTLTVDEASVELEIKIMMGGVVTSYPLTLTYRKQFDGADGKSTEFIFKGHTSDTTAPTLPSTSQQDDWYGQGTPNEWNDDLVEPTKALPYVWASQRKKINGVWGAFTAAKVWLRYAEDGDDAKSLILSASSLTMACYSANAAKPGQTITINAKLQNITGSASFTATPYNSSGTALTAITLGGSGNTRTLTNAQWLSTFQKVVITATISGLSDTVTITRLSDGDDGDGITSTTIHYAKSSNGTTPPSDGWSTSLPSPTQGWYLWTRTTTTYKVAETTVTYSVSYWAEDGDPAKSIHLNPSTKAIYITEGNTPAPASVTVTGTVVNTTIQYWYYSVNGATSFTVTAPTGVTRSGDQVTINSATATFKTLSIKARNITDDVEDVVTITRGGGAPYVDETTNTWWAWNETSGQFKNTGYSPVGSDGRIPYPAGYWEAKTYTRDANYAPYVQHTTAVYLLVEDSALSTDVPGTSNRWKAFNNWQAVFVDSLVAAFAKIGGAVFTGDTDPSSTIKGRMISQTGVDGTANYQNYTGDSGAWQPKIMLDFLTGKANFEDVKVAGRIISPYVTSLVTDTNNWIDVSTYSNFYVPTLPGGSGSGWYNTTLPSSASYNGITLSFVWRPIAVGYQWRIQAASGLIHTPSGDKTYVEYTSDTNRIVQLTAFWNTGTSRLEWILINDLKWGNDNEDRVLAGEVFLAGYVNSDGGVLQTSSKFGFTFSSSKVSTGQYSVTVSKYPNNPLNPNNYTQIITPYNTVSNAFAGLKTAIGTSFGVYTNSDNAPIDSPFKFVLIANSDLDLRNQTYL